MKQSIYLALAVSAVGSVVLAQSNERGPTYNAALTNAYSATDWGRRGTYPNGEVGVSFANQLCNPGTIPVNWFPAGSGAMQEDHPKFGFLVARDLDGRLVQISDYSYCKHAFFALSSPSVCGGTCVPTSGTTLGVSCSDIYSNSNNASQFYLGPPSEIDPWHGTWDATGSYFDIGHPGQAGYPLPADGSRSLSTSGYDNVEKRVTLQENMIPQGVDMYFQIFVIAEGERLENRANNIGTNTFRMTIANPTATGSSAWTTNNVNTYQQTSILHRWAGASIGVGSNGGTGTNADHDGRFEVAVKVSGPVNGFWHYEYAVLNIDNAGGGSAFRLPVCPTARVQNLGFRDIDLNPLNDWTATVGGGEIAWSAPAGNSHRWNQLFNFWFDSDAAPVAGNATIDQALLIEPLADLTLTVPTSVPGQQAAVYLGAGCGAPSMELAPNGLPTIGNAGFGLDVQTGPGTPFLTLFSSPSPAFNFGGCDIFLNIASYGDLGLVFADAAGVASVPIPVNPLWAPFDMTFQALTFVPAPPLFGLIGLSNGLTVRFGGTGCQ